MTELPSPSPYAYLDALPPAERLAARRLQEHRREDPTIALARRARDLQAELADYESLSEMVTGTSREPFSREIVGITIWDKETKTSVSFGPMYKHRSDELLAKCDSLRTMCAELVEALRPFAECHSDYVGFCPSVEERAAIATLTRARKLLEGE